MKKNIIYSALVIVLGIFVCVIAINPAIIGNNSNNQLAISNGDKNNEPDEKNPVAGSRIKFSTEDLNGNTLNDNILKEQELTILNLWSTNCTPCVEEIPDLEKIANDFKGKVRVIGLIDKMEKKEAKELLKEKKINYTNLVINDELKKQITDLFDYIPVTLFIDKNGKILEKFISGGSDYDYFKEIIEELLNK